ncbi:hypothetical protein ACH5RR_019153 [Cinchona calisaya]|uniref:Uncharacterized protein n=1 Tax=Cinchona calisaya TaxID=153742 RepID=A0ABD2ZNW1_9GENT
MEIEEKREKTDEDRGTTSVRRCLCVKCEGFMNGVVRPNVSLGPWCWIGVYDFWAFKVWKRATVVVGYFGPKYCSVWSDPVGPEAKQTTRFKSNPNGALSRRSSTDISAGIPFKKRRFLLDSPSSPPCQEPLPEVIDVKKNDESSSDTKNNEKSGSDSVEKKDSSLELKNKEESTADLKKIEESASDLPNKVASTTDSKNDEKSTSSQGPSNLNVSSKSPGTSDVSKINLLEVKKESISAPNANLVRLDTVVSVLSLPELSPMITLGSANRVESKTEFLSTGKSASPEVPGTSIDAPLVSVKKEIHSQQVEEECKLELSKGSGNNDDKLASEPKEFIVASLSVDPSLFSLSLSKEKPITEEKSGDTSLNNCSISGSANRSNWDLNTTMDAWEEGSVGDAAFQGIVDGSGKTISVNNERPLSSTAEVSVCSEKGKEVIARNEPKSSSPFSSVQLNQQHDDSLRLTLSSSFREMGSVREPPGLSKANVASRMKVSTDLRSELVSTLNKNSSGCRIVKSEPTDENSKNNSVGATNSSSDLRDFSAVKSEHIEKHNTEAVEFSASSPQELTGQMSIKSEPTIEVSQELCRAKDLRPQQSTVKFVSSQDSGSSFVLPMPLTPQKPSPSRLPASSELSTSADVSTQSERSVHTKEPRIDSADIVQADVDLIPKTAIRHRIREGNMAGHKIDISEVGCMNVVDPEVKRANERLHDLPVNGQESVSDEEKINISAGSEDESYDSECESDGNQAFGRHLDTQDRGGRDDDDYEDGEVRDALENSKIEEPTADGIIEDSAKHGDCNNKHCSSVYPGDTNTEQSRLDHKENELKIHDITAVDYIKESVGTVSNKNCEQLTANDGPSDKLSSDGMVTTGVDVKEPCNSSQRKLLDRTGKKSSQEGVENETSCDGITGSGSRTVAIAGEAKGEIAKSGNMAEKPDSPLSIVEASLNGNNAAKDSSSGGNKSRIINLPRASAASPGKTRSILDRLLSSRNGRERYSDLDGEKFIPQGKRDEIDSDSPQRFIRERIQYQPFRNSRSNYTRGRGRFSGRLDASRSEWGSDRDFAFEGYNDDYRFTRNKHAAVISDTELGCSDYVIPPDGAALSSVRGRKPLNDDLPSFRRPSSRRLSPRGRDGPGGRESQILRRIPRNISPSRHNDQNGVDFVGLRQDEKYTSGLPDDIIDPAYNRPHSMYDGGDTQFERANRNFPTFQRRGFPRVRSKSPVGSRTRSPGSWSSPRRRSSDGFSGLPQLTQHRSPAMYGVERMRSPDRSCFPEEMVARRRGSPSYLARPPNDTRDVDSGRDHGHPRPINSSRRSPSDRVFNRSTRNRRLDDVDPRIRSGDDEYFGRPVHSGRFQEFHGEGSSDERRKCGDRRGLIRSFRPPYVSDSDNLRFHLDDGPRPFRFCSEEDPEFVGRGIREREFDGRMKNRPTVAPRRIRSIDDQEGNYRHRGQVWPDDGFSEGSGFKRRRF